MSRSLEQQPQSAVVANAQPELDVEAEHDPAISRRASLAGLRREAIEVKDEGAMPTTRLSINDLAGVPTTSAAPKAGQTKTAPQISSASIQDQKTQRTVGRTESAQGLLATMLLAAQRMDIAADKMNQARTTKPDAGGPGKLVNFAETAFKEGSREIAHVNRVFSSETPALAEVKPGLQALIGAFHRFGEATKDAQMFAKGVGLTLHKDPDEQLAEMNRDLQEIQKRFDLDLSGPSRLAHGPVSGQPEPRLRDSAIKENCEASQANARYVRMAMTTESADVLTPVLSTLYHHAQEVELLVTQLEKGARPKYRPMVIPLVNELDELLKELRPDLAKRFGREELVRVAATLRGFAK
jgi:hypothetical protein